MFMLICRITRRSFTSQVAEFPQQPTSPEASPQDIQSCDTLDYLFHYFLLFIHGVSAQHYED